MMISEYNLMSDEVGITAIVHLQKMYVKVCIHKKRKGELLWTTVQVGVGFKFVKAVIVLFFSFNSLAPTCAASPLRRIYTPPWSAVYRHGEPSTSTESLSETLFISLRTHSNIFKLSIEATEMNRDGKGYEWSSNKIISGITFRSLTLHLSYFIHCLLCTLRANKTPNKIWKAIINTIDMVSRQYKIDRAANCIAYPTSRWRTANARGVSVVTEPDYGYGVVYFVLLADCCTLVHFPWNSQAYVRVCVYIYIYIYIFSGSVRNDLQM